jgi:ComF family protein
LRTNNAQKPVLRRVVFSSSEDLTRSARSKVASVETSVVSWVSGAAESLFATLFPSDCRLCGTPLVKISRLPVCEDCLLSIRPLSESVCGICGERLASAYNSVVDGGQPRCPICRESEPAYARALAYGSYEGGLRDLIQLLKYQRVRPAAQVLGRMLAEVVEALAPSFGEPAPVVVPVPLYKGKIRERGFNQSELIARAALKLKPLGQEVALRPQFLERCRPTASQTGLTRHQRRENMRGAFRAVQPAEIAGREILLVDDVLTTGTTASECARVLRRAGAIRVWVATVARTLKAETAAMTVQSQPEEDENEARLSRAAHG